MYEPFFQMTHTPFTRNIPANRLYVSEKHEDAIGRLKYTADHDQFAAVLADPGCGKTTLIRMLKERLPADQYLMLYLSDSKLTPRWLYAGLLDQLGLKPKFYRGDSKRELQKAIEAFKASQNRKVICVLDEAHLLEKETLEEFRFLLNCQFDSESPMSLILVGQKELWEQKLRLQAYAAICQRIDWTVVLERLSRAEARQYIAAHVAYSGCTGEVFTSDAEDEIYKVSAGIPRMINQICKKSLIYACQQQKRLIDGHMVRYVADHEILKAEDSFV